MIMENNFLTLATNILYELEGKLDISEAETNKILQNSTSLSKEEINKLLEERRECDLSVEKSREILKTLLHYVKEECDYISKEELLSWLRLEVGFSDDELAEMEVA